MRASFAVALVLTVLLPAGLAAQARGVILGRVLDETTDAPIPAAYVQLVAESGRTIQQGHSDGEGRVALPIRAAGRYRLRATSLGYAESLTAPFHVETRDKHRLHPIGAESWLCLVFYPLDAADRPVRMGCSRPHVHPTADSPSDEAKSADQHLGGLR